MLNCARHSTVRMLVTERMAQEEGAMGREALVVWREVSLIQREEAVAHREEVTKEDAVRVREELVEERARTCNKQMNFTSGNCIPGGRFFPDLLDTSVCIHQLVLNRQSKH